MFLDQWPITTGCGRRARPPAFLLPKFKDRKLLIGRPLRRCPFLCSYNSLTHILCIKLKGIYFSI